MANLPSWVSSGPPITDQQRRDAERYIRRRITDEPDRITVLAALGLTHDNEQKGGAPS
ncbi:hypothetical protein [Streptomyces macrosporus]|uniref:Transposase n=1 Tax=Streptomyces macrosporus TaxID=44032 RepID=A0ABN3KEJ7_9ACTN